MSKLWLAIFATASLASTSYSQAGQDFDYNIGRDTFQGYLALPKNKRTNNPTILLVHDWNGIDAFEKERADRLAELGYTAFCVDVYGKGVRPRNVQESAAESGKYYKNPKLWHQRLRGALETLSQLPYVDRNRIGAIGYCFGGTAVLEMARQNMPVDAVVSFHGGLAGPSRAGRSVKPAVLVLHGDADTLVPEKEVRSLTEEMNAAKATWRLVSFRGAKHAFTVPGSEKSGIEGVGYQEKADKDSWVRMRDWLQRYVR